MPERKVFRRNLNPYGTLPPICGSNEPPARQKSCAIVSEILSAGHSLHDETFINVLKSRSLKPRGNMLLRCNRGPSMDNRVCAGSENREALLKSMVEAPAVATPAALPTRNAICRVRRGRQRIAASRVSDQLIAYALLN